MPEPLAQPPVVIGARTLPDGGSAPSGREARLAAVKGGASGDPIAGSQASVESVATSGASVVNYHFPVEITIVGELSEEMQRRIEARIWEQLRDALDRNG